MNKTISINIGGMIFQIDEEAYKILEQYLESLKQHFASTEGHEEIIQDIEARIGEIFQTKIESGQLLILKENVEEAINILGKPGDIDNNGSEKETREEPKKTSKKRLFRDEDNRVIGGVCSGLGHYLDIDPIWFRLGFLISLFFAGTGAVVYIVLWIIIPRAATTEERMHMRGSPMTITEIENNIKNEFEDLKTRFHEMKGSAKRRSRREMHEMKRKIRQAKNEAKYSYTQRYMASAIAGPKPESVRHHGFGSVFGEIIYYLLRALLAFVGIVLLVLAIVLTASLILSLTASDSFLFFTKWGISSVSLPALSHLFFENIWQQQLVVVSLILLIGVPLLMLIFNSIRMIIGFKTKSRIVSVTASLLWLSGLILAILLTVNIAGNFSEKSSVKQEIMLPQPKETLTLDVTDNLPGIKDSYNHDDEESADINVNDHQRFIFNNCFFADHGDNLMAYGFPKLKIIPSKTGQYKLTVIKFARGTTLMAARERAEAIRSEVNIPDSSVVINNYFLLPEHEKWRNQSVKLILEVPEGKSIFMTKNVENLIYDRDNTDGSWNTEMTGKRMTMHEGRLIENAEIAKTDSVAVQKPVIKK
jgi:phage shock protein PspC (stress-responsive transcriptional regulator)